MQNRSKAAPLPVLAMLLLASSAGAQDTAPGWTGTGELGLAIARGNARTENINAKLALAHESAQWTHKLGFAAVRARSEVDGDLDGDGVPDRRYELSANRYQLNASSAYNMNPRASWVSAVRFERDDFSAFERQGTLSVGFGYRYIDTEDLRLATELGPGYRRAERRQDGATESEMILRGLLEYRQKLTATTSLTNTLLVESGDSNTFAQNDAGVAVAMNSRLALKAGVQIRHNTEVEPGTRRTDTLTTVNLVYSLK